MFEIVSVDIFISIVYTSGQTLCTECNNGTYQSATGQAACLSCLPGQISGNAGAVTACVDCIVGKIQINKGATSLEFRKKMSRLAFSETAYYDATISNYFNKNSKIYFPEKKIIYGNIIEKLREQTLREPFAFPTVEITNKYENIEDYKISDFVLTHKFLIKVRFCSTCFVVQNKV